MCSLRIGSRDLAAQTIRASFYWPLRFETSLGTFSFPLSVEKGLVMPLLDLGPISMAIDSWLVLPVSGLKLKSPSADEISLHFLEVILMI